MLKRRAWQLAHNATGRVTRGREEKEREHPGAGMQEQIRTQTHTHTHYTLHWEDFDSLILPCVALIRREIPSLQRR